MFPIQNSKQCPCIYLVCMSFRLTLSPICFSGFLRCKVADFSALSSLPTLQFESSLICKVFTVPSFSIFICCCFHYSYLLVSLNINFVFLHPCCFEGVRGVLFKRRGPQTSLPSRSKSTSDHLSPLWR